MIEGRYLGGAQEQERVRNQPENKPTKPFSMKLMMDDDETSRISPQLMGMASQMVAGLMHRVLQHGGFVTMEADARKVTVVWNPPPPQENSRPG